MNARQAALEIVTNVLQNESYLNLECKRVLSTGWSVEDKRFITALANTTIENLFRIDYVLNQFITAKRVHNYGMNTLCGNKLIQHVINLLPQSVFIP